ncbi:MAG: NAD(P)H-hydrate epimerase [Acidimicrobiia bacterium]
MVRHLPQLATTELPWLTTSQMVEVDRAMIEDYSIDLVQMMENAGRTLAHLARARFLDGDPVGRRIVVLAGTGGNGGGALVAARRLHSYGAQVEVLVAKAAVEFAPVPAHQLDIVRRMGIKIGDPAGLGAVDTPDLVVDGVIGYSLRGAPRDGAAELIRWANHKSAPVLSLDVPSGIDADSGTVFDPAVVATATMTLALPKEGLRVPGIERVVGELYLADIGVPPELYSRFLGIEVGPLFAESDVLLLS